MRLDKLLFYLFIFFGMFFLVFSQSYITSAATNTTINTTLYIPSSPFFIGSSVLDDSDPNVASQLDLVPANTTVVWCNGTANDSRGYSNLASVSGVLYLNSTSPDSPDNYSNHYTDSDCNLSLDIDGKFSCQFNLKYYASPGTWLCRINVTNSLGFYNTSTLESNVTELLALDIVNSSLDFGMVNSGTNTSSGYNIPIKNNGNIPIDIQIDAYVNSSDDSDAFDCDVGSIPVEYVHYSLENNISYDNQDPLSALGYVTLSLFDLNPQNSLSNSNKSVYFNIGVPTGVSGQCNGYLSVVGISS